MRSSLWQAGAQDRVSRSLNACKESVSDAMTLHYLLASDHRNDDKNTEISALIMAATINNDVPFGLC
jgi:hypothetical protein